MNRREPPEPSDPPASLGERLATTFWLLPAGVLLGGLALLTDAGAFPPPWDPLARVGLHVAVPLFAADLVLLWWRPAWLRAMHRHLRLTWDGAMFLARFAAGVAVILAVAWVLVRLTGW